MTISELSAGQGNVNVNGTITEVGEVKIFNKFGKELKVSNAILKDDSGTIKLTLWNDEASKFKEGDKVKIENGYVNEFQGEPQLTAGKFGKIEKIGEGADSGDVESEDESFLEKAEDKIKEVAEDVKEKVEEIVDKIKGDDEDEEEDKEESEDSEEDKEESEDSEEDKEESEDSEDQEDF